MTPRFAHSAGSTDGKPSAIPVRLLYSVLLPLRLQQGSDKGCGHLYRDRRVSFRPRYVRVTGADRQKALLTVRFSS
ncbi:hypothetical protein KCP78_19425 [Salmonella enterica subsp. enterica]|nr:hypothetical protein KCP78_19425 [Salmonella enterica subsp. enterica]